MTVAVGQVRNDDGTRDGQEWTDLRYKLKIDSKHLLIA